MCFYILHIVNQCVVLTLRSKTAFDKIFVFVEKK